MSSGHAWRSAAGAAASRQEVACSVFLARHSAWLDDELTPLERAAHERHLAECGSCGRYARVLARGTEVLRGLPQIEPSEDFGARLQHRLFHVDDEAAFEGRRRTGRWAATAALLGVIAAAPFVVEQLAASRARALAPGPVPPQAHAHPYGDGLLVPGAAFEPVGPLALTGAPAAFRAAGYTPVVIRPPLFRAASAASVSYGD